MLTFQKIDLVGDSYGGLLAMAYATHPDDLIRSTSMEGHRACLRCWCCGVAEDEFLDVFGDNDDDQHVVSSTSMEAPTTSFHAERRSR